MANYSWRWHREWWVLISRSNFVYLLLASLLFYLLCWYMSRILTMRRDSGEWTWWIMVTMVTLKGKMLECARLMWRTLVLRRLSDKRVVVVKRKLNWNHIAFFGVVGIGKPYPYCFQLCLLELQNHTLFYFEIGN
jgi:hypothetical protein